jgi:hypothetical protein
MKCKDCVDKLDSSTAKQKSFKEVAVEKVSKPDPTLTCLQCKISHPLAEYSKAQLKKGTDVKCKACIAAIEKTGGNNDPQKPVTVVSPISTQIMKENVQIPSLTISTAAPSPGSMTSVVQLQPIVVPITCTLPQMSMFAPASPLMSTQAGINDAQTAALSKCQREVESLKNLNQNLKSDIKRLRETLNKVKSEQNRRDQLLLFHDLAFLYKDRVFPTLLMGGESWPSLVGQILNEVSDAEDTNVSGSAEVERDEDRQEEDDGESESDDEEEQNEDDEEDDEGTDDDKGEKEIEKILAAKYSESFGFDIVAFIEVDMLANAVASASVAPTPYRLMSVKKQHDFLTKCKERKFDDDLQGFVKTMLSKVEESPLHKLVVM